jgi:hypothetical protein
VYIFYETLTDTLGRIESVVKDEVATPEQKEKGLYIEDFPVIEEKPGYTMTLYINLTALDIYPEYESIHGPGESIVLLKTRLMEAESKLQTAEERYLQADIRNINLEDLKKLKIEELKEKSNKAIETEFVSPSLGYTFGFKAHDQNNIANQALLFLANPLEESCDWKTEDAGIQTFTRDEFLLILPEGKEHTRKNIDKYWMLVERVMFATNKDEVQGVQWT